MAKIAVGLEMSRTKCDNDEMMGRIFIFHPVLISNGLARATLGE
tara:strand:+ start:420 stop:551 length:132 start_codon:yes stop_codon:yes gene_type:complete